MQETLWQSKTNKNKHINIKFYQIYDKFFEKRHIWLVDIIFRIWTVGNRFRFIELDKETINDEKTYQIKLIC